MQHNGELYKVESAVNQMLGTDDGSEKLAFEQLSLQAIYSSATKSISQYSQVIDAVTNLDATEAVRRTVVDSLGVMAEMPALWDAVEFAFEKAWNKAVGSNHAKKKFNEFSCNRDGKTGDVKTLKTPRPTRFETMQIGAGCCVPAAGFITPLFVALATALMPKFLRVLRPFSRA